MSQEPSAPSTMRKRLGKSTDRFGRAIRRRVAIDRRALAAFRISIAALLIADLVGRTRLLGMFYTDAGVLPREALFSDYSSLTAYSVHTLSGEAWAQWLLFLVAGLVALALLVGYRTRIATIVSWLLLVSLHVRNPMVLNAGDVLLRMLLFWSIFLPLGSRWSIDARRRNPAQSSGDAAPTIATIGTIAVLLQVLLMYLTNAVHKTRSDMWMSGEAVVHIFQADHLTVLLGNVLPEYTALLEVFTSAWMVLIVLSPLLLLLTGVPRALLVTGFAGMHLGMLVTLRIGLFPLIVVAGLLLFYPPVVWDTASSLAARVGIAGPLRRTLDRLQSRAPVLARWAPGSWLHSITSVSNENSDAEDATDDRRKDRMGDDTNPLTAVASRGRVFVTTIIPWLLLVLVVLSNAEAVGYTEVPDAGNEALDTLQASQSWRMFAPNPTSTAQWFVVPGELENGTTVDALHGSGVDWDRPPNVDGTYETARERKYLSNMRFAGNENHHSYYANYLCDRWNREHDTTLENLTIYGMSDRSGPYTDEPDISKSEVIEYDCSGEFIQEEESDAIVVTPE
ncbi:HTTM domain-containing protein [Natrialba sp. PRR66]|uniref:HTTM domain-containing protein n=1 Tax=Natrialba sp. PRR66 TaxID=3098146 RepID=UPI002B1E3843|nr:HTTM domain-containing protein [Natrialba sp. PRR66]